MASNLIVARFTDGRTLKGSSLNVDPDRPTFHVSTESGLLEVKLSDLKALFFVKDAMGDPSYREAMTAPPGDLRLVGGKRIAVRFRDGERVIGMTMRFPPPKKFFFMVPADPKSNNIRILVNRDATLKVEEITGPLPPPAASP